MYVILKRQLLGTCAGDFLVVRVFEKEYKK